MYRYVVYLLQPFHQSFNKRIVKQPKLYFYDTGLLCSLLGIHSEHQLHSHYNRGNIFESFVISEYLKRRFNRGMLSNAYFWRDSSGHEVDLIIEDADRISAMEIKSGETISSDFFKGLRYFKLLASQPDDSCYLIYGGNLIQSRTHGQVLGWRHLDKMA